MNKKSKDFLIGFFGMIIFFILSFIFGWIIFLSLDKLLNIDYGIIRSIISIYIIFIIIISIYLPFYFSKKGKKDISKGILLSLILAIILFTIALINTLRVLREFF